MLPSAERADIVGFSGLFGAYNQRGELKMSMNCQFGTGLLNSERQLKVFRPAASNQKSPRIALFVRFPLSNSSCKELAR